MESETVLDSVEFHFTPTRTRCDFVIFANGKTEKLASGLANPFLVQLKAVQDQIANGGGYSISLMPDSTKDKTWFTKGTVERFVRFVNNPSVLERVSTIEAEILHIEEAIKIHSNFHLGIKTLVTFQTSCTDSIKGHTVMDAYTEREAVLNQEKNSNVRLLRVLESRISALQIEQEMAFGRATTAGFNPNHIRHLVLFAACFGASRLLEACLRYMELWKKKHEPGLWSMDIEANRLVKSPSEFSSLDIPAISISSEEKKQTEDEGSAHSHEFSNLNHVSGLPLYGGHQNGVFFQGQYQVPPYVQWWMHPSPVGHFYQHYPGEMMHFNSCYSRHNPFFQAPHAPIEEQTHEASQISGNKKHTVSAKNSCSTSINDRKDSSVPKDDNAKKCVFSIEKKSVKQRKKLPVNSNKHDASEIDDVWYRSKIESEEEENEVYQLRKDYERRSCEIGERFYPEVKSDNDAWQVHENFSVRNAEGSSYPAGRDILSSEKEIYYNRKKTRIFSPILDGNQERSYTPEQKIHMVKFDNDIINTISECIKRPSIDELIISEEGSHAIDNPARGNNDVLPSELTTVHKNLNQLSGKLMTRQLNKELDGMSLMPKSCGLGRSNSSCNESVIGCELVVHEKKAASKGIKVVDGTVASNVLKRVDKLGKNIVCMLKLENNTRKGKSPNLSTSTNGQTSERSRVHKPDPQEIKKQKEKADIKRLVTLKSERQRRISARSSSAAGSPMNPPSMLNHTFQ